MEVEINTSPRAPTPSLNGETLFIERWDRLQNNNFPGLNNIRGRGGGVKYAATSSVQERKFMSCSHCQELCQQASWLLIGCTRVQTTSQKPGQQVDTTLDMTTNHKFPL